MRNKPMVRKLGKTRKQGEKSGKAHPKPPTRTLGGREHLLTAINFSSCGSRVGSGRVRVGHLSIQSAGYTTTPGIEGPASRPKRNEWQIWQIHRGITGSRLNETAVRHCPAGQLNPKLKELFLCHRRMSCDFTYLSIVYPHSMNKNTYK